jgi:hypothetical protein
MALNLDPTQNPWLQFLEDQPKSAFLGAADRFLGGAGNTNQNRQSLDQVFQQTMNDFQQELGRRSLNNENPNLLFSQFAGGLSDQDFTKRFARVTDQRPSQQKYNPRTRKLYFS